MDPEPAAIWTTRCFFLVFGRHLADWGSHSWPRWIPMGSPNRHFGRSSWKNDEKLMSGNETKHNITFNRKLIPNSECLKGKFEHLAGELLQNTMFGRYEILRKSVPKWITKTIKNKDKNAPRSDFQILERFRGS